MSAGLKNKSTQAFGAWYVLGFGTVAMLTLLVCLCAGSVSIPPSEALSALWKNLWGQPLPQGRAASIIVSVRLPRVLCVGLTGAALSLCGAVMQGLMRNPLADGSTMGVSSGASLGAVLAISLGISIPGLPYAGTIGMAMLFGFGALMLVLALSFALDRSLATYSIILLGVVFTMFFSSIISLVTVFAGEKVKSITFWTMGSLAGSSAGNAWMLLFVVIICGGGLLRYARELDVFALGEMEAGHIGVPVKRVKLMILILVSTLIGVCVSIGGNIGFVGLVTPHIMRRLMGPGHRRLLPASMFSGAIFLMLADLVSRTLLSPIELPIGVVTSLVGSIVFVGIFYHSRKRREA